MKFHRDWYYRLIIQMKDDRVKISIYDDGNAFWPGNSAGPGLSSRTYYFATYTFKKNEEYRGSDPTPLLNVKQKCIDDVNSIIKAIQTQEKNIQCGRRNVVIKFKKYEKTIIIYYYTYHIY